MDTNDTLNALKNIPKEVQKAFDESKKYFLTPIQEMQFYDKYARFDYDKGRRETWTETVDRAANYLQELSSNQLTPQEYARIRKFILEMKSAPSMRLLAMAGPAARRNQISIFNCSYNPIDSLDALVEIMLISMAGTGAGYSVEKYYVDQLPVVAMQTGEILPTYQVADSTEGWADAFRFGLESWFSGKNLLFDYSLIRPAGTPLKVKGGRASGPLPLKNLLDFSRRIILSRQGKQLRPIDAHDIACMIGRAIVAGSVRRSALISLFDFDDIDMRECKNGENIEGNEQRWMSNNSAVWPDKMSQEDILSQMHEMITGQRGEPGIFSRYNANQLAPERRKRFGYKYLGTNPCFAPGTLVHTKQGHFPIEDLVGKTVDVWDGTQWVQIDNFRITAENQSILKITTQDGAWVRATKYHKFILEDGRKLEAKDLKEGDRLMLSSAPLSHGILHAPGAYLKGFLVGDGTHFKDRPILWLYDSKNECEKRLIQSAQEVPVGEKHTTVLEELDFVAAGNNRKNMRGLALRKTELLPWTTEYKKRLPNEIFAWDLSSKLEFIAGVMDADGCALNGKKGYGYQIWSINKEWLLDFQALLKTIGVFSKVSFGKKAGKKDFQDGYGEYESKESWRLNISSANGRCLSKQVTFSRLLSFRYRKEGAYRPIPNRNQIVSIIEDGVEAKVYCCTVPTNHVFSLTNGYPIVNCGEINLRSHGFCVSGNTPLITRQGIVEIERAVGEEIEVWNGQKWSKVSPVKTRTNQKLLRVWFGDGSYLDCTSDHKFSVSHISTRFRKNGFQQKTAQEIKETIHRKWSTEPFKIEYQEGKDFELAYSLGFAVGDGCIDTNGKKTSVYADLYGEKDEKLPIIGTRYKQYLPKGYNVARTRVRLPEAITPEFVRELKTNHSAFDEIFTWNKKSILEFIAGIADADGNNTQSGTIRIYISDFERAHKIQLLLTKCGIRSSVNLFQRKGTKTNLGERKRDLWYLQITDCQEVPTHRLDCSGGHAARCKGKYQNIIQIEELDGEHDVFCFTENERNMGVFNNTLTYQCNLSIAIAREDDTEESLKEKVEVATMIGTIQSLATNYPGLRDIWRKNAEEERLLGVDINGWRDCKLLSPTNPELPKILERLRKHAVEVNKKYAQVFGINQSASVTCVKPSGNSGVLFNCASGLHPRWSRYYIRNARIQAGSPLKKVLTDAGVPMDPENGQGAKTADTWVVHFPIKSPDDAILRNDLSAIEQCEYWLKAKKYWTEHNPSVTITYDPKTEAVDLIKWVSDYQDWVGGMSFLPRDDAQYSQMPYQEISKEEYEQLSATFPPIDFSHLYLYEQEDLTSASQELACVGNSCELP